MKNAFVPELNAMIDVAGNSAPKIETLKDYALILSKFGYKSLYISFEDMIEVDGEPYFGYQRGRYHKKDLKELDAYCQSIGIEVVPLIATLSHCFNFWKHTGVYGKIMDGQGMMLADYEDTYVFLEKVIATVSECFKTRKIHLGMDDAYRLGRMRYLDMFGYQKFSDVFLRHATKLNGICKKYGYDSEIWSNMLVDSYFKDELSNMDKSQIRDLVGDKLPKDVKVVYQNFYDIDGTSVADTVKNNSKLSDNTGYCATALKGYGFSPDNGHSIKAIKAGLDAVKENSVKDFYVYAISRQGGEQSIYNALPSLFFASEYANGRASGLDDLDKAKFKDIIGVEFDDFMLLDLGNKPHLNKEYNTYNTKSYFYFYNDPLIGMWDAILSEGIGDGYLACSKLLAKVKGGKYQLLFKEASALCKFLSNKAELGKNLTMAYKAGDKKELKRITSKVIPTAIKDADKFFKLFAERWHKESKTIGFEVQDQRWGGMIERLSYVAQRVNKYINGELDKLWELEEPKLLPDMRMNMEDFNEVKARDGINEDNYILYEWKWTVSVNVTD